jgi:hypothetical protein
VTHALHFRPARSSAPSHSSQTRKQVFVLGAYFAAVRAAYLLVNR